MVKLLRNLLIDFNLQHLQNESLLLFLPLKTIANFFSSHECFHKHFWGHKNANLSIDKMRPWNEIWESKNSCYDSNFRMEPFKKKWVILRSINFNVVEFLWKNFIILLRYLLLWFYCSHSFFYTWCIVKNEKCQTEP